MATSDQRQQVVITQYNIAQGISEEQYRRLAGELGVTRSALTSFFKILEQQVPPEDLDHTLRQIATSYKDLHAKLQRFRSDDPAILALKQQAHEAMETGEFARAEALLNKATAKDLEAVQQLQEVTATRLRSAAASRAANGDLKQILLACADAAAYYRQAVDLLELLPTANLELAEYLNAWGLVSYKVGEYPAAEPLFQRALAIREHSLGLQHPYVASSLSGLARVYSGQGRYGEAEALYQRALAIDEHSLGPMHPDVAQNLNSLGSLYYIQGRDAEAEPLLQRSLAIREQALGPMHPDVAQSLNNLPGLYRKWGRYTEAELLLQRALTIAEQVFEPTHPLVAAVRKNYAALLQAKQRKAAPLISLWQWLRAWLSRTRAIR